jgi:sugar transferase (PEP-CTERM/EpsH1 system associated)
VAAEHVHALGNGVDLDYFDGQRAYPNPYPPGGPVLVFTGMMDYRANVDAVCWFADMVLPEIRARHADVRFAIVGAKPDQKVKRLAERPGIIVTGRVEDVRPYVAHANVAVAPLRIARGIQNKVLEAMAMAQPVVASAEAFEGIDAEPGVDLAVADGTHFADPVCRLLENPEEAAAMGLRGRQRLTGHYTWERQLAPLARIVEGV